MNQTLSKKKIEQATKAIDKWLEEFTACDRDSDVRCDRVVGEEDNQIYIFACVVGDITGDTAQAEFCFVGEDFSQIDDYMINGIG